MKHDRLLAFMRKVWPLWFDNATDEDVDKWLAITDCAKMSLGASVAQKAKALMAEVGKEEREACLNIVINAQNSPTFRGNHDVAIALGYVAKKISEMT